MKPLLASLLLPFVRLVQGLAPLTRLWAWTRLRAHVPDLPADCVVLGTPEVQGTGRLRCGHRLYLYRELHLETQGDGEIVLGNDVVLSRGVHVVAHQRVAIGDGSMVGEYSSIRDANHNHDSGGSGLPLRDAGHSAQAVHIGRQVWIGRGVTVLAGVTIGDHAVVGANAVVTRDVAAHAVVGGVPARPLHRGTSP